MIERSGRDPLDRLPVVGERRVAVRVTPDALRQIRGGSPWLFDGSITSVSHDGRSGDLAVVFDERRAFAAIGLWDPTSPIRVRILHRGRPTPIDVGFWRDRLDAALVRRAELVDDPATTGYRCVHGENDGLPGLVVDRYAGTLVVKLYTPAWFPHLRDVVGVLGERLGAERVVLRLARAVATSECHGLGDGDVLVGPAVDGPVRFLERGLHFEADVVRGQKTGHFLDQRDNRSLVRDLASGADVLDVFASTGGFSVAAAAGGANSVHLVDRSAEALATAERNLAHNRDLDEVRRCEVRVTIGDAFGVMEQLAADGERYDVVVVDPPSFASTRAAVGRALASYARLTRLAVELSRGTILQCSCSSRVGADDLADTVRGAAGAGARIVRRTGHAVDHPIGFEHGEYLHAVQLERRRRG